VLPAVLAAAELVHASGAAFARAAAIGLEICVRLGMAGYDRDARQSIYFERGLHATSMCGAIGGAAAAAVLLHADPAHAMGIAVSMASGVIEGNRAGGTVKRLHCGWAAQSAVTAALLARRGFTGPPTALEGRFGFFEAFCGGRYDAGAVREALGTRWDSLRTFVKPYPANHFTHAAIDVAIDLRRSGLRPDDVESVEIGVAAPTVRTIGDPIDAKRAPASGYQAQFSGPFTFAAALCGGGGLGVNLDDFTDDRARDPRLRALAARVSVTADAECDAIYPDQLPAIVRVRTRDGRERVERVLTNRGGPDRPLGERLRDKFMDNATRVLSPGTAEQLAVRIATLETLPGMSDLLPKEE
jgi:2-methylcitrate dehydratase PrpD